MAEGTGRGKADFFENRVVAFPDRRGGPGLPPMAQTYVPRPARSNHAGAVGHRPHGVPPRAPTAAVWPERHVMPAHRCPQAAGAPTGPALMTHRGAGRIVTPNAISRRAP